MRLTLSRPLLAPTLTVAFLCAGAVRAQTPHLAGRLLVEPERGMLAGHVCLSGFAPRVRPRFLLSAALNVKVVTDTAGRALEYAGEYDGRMVGEGREYVLVRADRAAPMTALCVEYRGAVPPFESNTASGDWKGRIVSIGGVMRASEQSKWVPALRDSATGRLEQDVTYDLSVRCAGCEGIYVNGSRPVAGDSGRFTSSTPRPPMLFAGRIQIHETPELTFVGGDAGADAVSSFSAAVRQLSAYYERLLGMPQRETPTFLTFRSVWNERHPGVPDWQFVTWPTIAMSGGVTFDSVLVLDRGRRVLPRAVWTTLAHEMGHYYFGASDVPRGPLYWLVLESIPEYLSLKAVAALHGPVAGAARALAVAQAMGTTTLPALDRVAREDEITGTYRYQYAPAFLLSLDSRYGEAKVAAMLRALLPMPAGQATDFARLASAAETAGIPRAALTEGWTVSEIQRAIVAASKPLLSRAVADPAAASDAVSIAGALVSLDTATASRLGVMSALRTLVRRDPAQLAAHYQIGRTGALTGRELDAAQASLERYLRHPPAAGGPSHAAAYWRIGQIEEHRGRTDRARGAYRASLTRDPDFGPAREALERLGEGHGRQ